MQQQDLPAAAPAACCSRKMQQEQQQQAPTSRSAVYPALLGTRCNQRRHNEKIPLIFLVVLFVRDQAAMSTLDANRLDILLSPYTRVNNHQASSAV